MRKHLRALLLILFCSGCSTTKYLYQAAKGQLSLCNRARPLEEVLRDDRVSKRVRDILTEIPSIKAFGEKQGLKPTSNYREYVQLDRPAVSYIVSACDELEFKPKIWSFPIIGSVPYLGWFSVDDAKNYAAELRAEGYDVDLRGARAYSTLGWFRDAVLSSMIPPGDEALGEVASVIIHESVHATLYISGQTQFNESLAEFVAKKLTPRYLIEKTGADSPQLKSYLAGEKQGIETIARLRAAYENLDSVYRSSISMEEKRQKKSETLATLRSALDWKRDLNNATLMQFKAYESGEKGFELLFERSHRDVSQFLKFIELHQKTLFQKDQDEKIDEALSKLVSSL